jgi:hypothetical protein
LDHSPWPALFSTRTDTILAPMATPVVTPPMMPATCVMPQREESLELQWRGQLYT